MLWRSVIGRPVELDGHPLGYEGQVEVRRSRREPDGQLADAVRESRIVAEHVPQPPQLQFTSAPIGQRVAEGKQRRPTLDVHPAHGLVPKALCCGSSLGQGKDAGAR
jgi:hypothetical protein